MEFFSEIYNCYYQIMKCLLKNSSAITTAELYEQISLTGYEESLFHLIPKLTSGEWNLFKTDGTVFVSKLKTINEQILKIAQSYPTTFKTSSSDAPFFMD